MSRMVLFGFISCAGGYGEYFNRPVDLTVSVAPVHVGGKLCPIFLNHYAHPYHIKYRLN
jgi:hypothetical protein